MNNLSESMLNFNESWLAEMPKALVHLDKSEFFQDMLGAIEEELNRKKSPISVSNILSKIAVSKEIYYFYHRIPSVKSIRKYLDSIDLIAGFRLTPGNMTVTGVAKRPGTNIPVVQMYLDVLADQRQSSNNAAIRLNSDDTMSIGGLKIWEKLFAAGHKLYYYNKDRPENLVPITNIAYLKSLHGHSDAYKNYQFVLTENETVADTIFESFMMYRVKNLINYPGNSTK
jgi:hypothetical protein